MRARPPEVDASTEINVHADELNDDEEKKKASPANTNALGASLAVFKHQHDKYRDDRSRRDD